MLIKIQEAVRLVNQEFIQSFHAGTGYREQDLRKICRFLEEVCKERNIEFVHGRGKRRSIEQRYLELFQRYLDRQTLMTGIKPASREETTTARQIRMQHLCI